MLKAVILRNNQKDEHLPWVQACEAYKSEVTYRIVDLTAHNWLEEIQKEEVDVLLAKPACLTNSLKQLYDERIYILSEVLNHKIFPDPQEIYIYENKRLLSFWLKANRIPHPKTNVFYQQKEANRFMDNSQYPVIAKTNIGAAGSGVKIIANRVQMKDYIQSTFSGTGAPKRWGPNLKKGNLIGRIINLALNPKKLVNTGRNYLKRKQDHQKGFVIFQEFVEHDFEWRVVRIGDSFFAHKKLKIGEKASGSILKKYDNPPLSLFDFVKGITDKHKFYSQAVDVFETTAGDYLVNEMQCIFGQSDDFQMMIDGKIGRYICQYNSWVFEEGDFNKNQSYNLRVKTVIEMYGKR